MKKLTMLALGLGLAIGSVSFAAPQDTTKTDDTTKTKKHKKKKKSGDTTMSTDKKM